MVSISDLLEVCIYSKSHRYEGNPCVFVPKSTLWCTLTSAEPDATCIFFHLVKLLRSL